MPTNITGYKASAVMEFDSTVLGTEKMKKLEDKLYGDGTNEAELPTPDELIALLKAA